MKKIFLIAVLFCGTSIAYANNFYVDAIGSYGDYGDAKTIFGYGGGIGYQVAPRFNAWFHYLHGSASSSQTNQKTAEYQHDIWYFSGEYTYPISDLPLYWTSAAGAGIANMKINHFNNTDPTIMQGSDTGIFAGIWTGARYHLTQHVGVFALAGYQMMTQFQNKLISAKIQGYQFQFGVTATVFGKNSTVDEEY